MIYRATASRLCRGAAWQALKSPAPPRPAAPPRGPRFVSCNPAQGQCVGYETMLNCSQTEIGGAPRLALLSAVRSPPFLRQDTWNLVGRARPGIVAPFSVRRFSGDSEKKEEGGGGRDVDPVELLQAIESCERVNDMLRLWAGYEAHFNAIHMASSWTVFARVAGEWRARQLAGDLQEEGEEEPTAGPPVGRHLRDPAARELLWKHKQMTMSMLDEDIVSVAVLAQVINGLAALMSNGATTSQEVDQAFLAIFLRIREKVMNKTDPGEENGLTRDLNYIDVWRFTMASIRFTLARMWRKRQGDDDDDRGGNRPVGTEWSWRDLLPSAPVKNASVMTKDS